MTRSKRLRRDEIRRLFALLNPELGARRVIGELYLVGGAVMCLALDARDATANVDALFQPARAVREAAARVAIAANVSETWLNDAVKGYLSPRGDFDDFLELPNLRVFTARPEYLLAMKCAALRIRGHGDVAPPPRGDQSRLHRWRRDGRRAVSPRNPHGGVAHTPAHRAGARRGRGGRAALVRDAVDDRRVAARATRERRRVVRWQRR